MEKPFKNNRNDQKIKLLRRRIRNREFQRSAIFSCKPGNSGRVTLQNINGKVWDVIYFLAVNEYAGMPLRSSDIYLGTGLPKRTVMRIIDRLQLLNVVAKNRDPRDRRVTRVGLSATFIAELDAHLHECLSEKL